MHAAVTSSLEPREFAKYRRFEHFEWMHARYVTHHFAPHTHEGFAIGVIERGVEAFKYRKTTHFAVAGSTIAVNPDEVHTGFAASADGWQYRMFYPNAAWLEHLASELGLRGLPFFRSPVAQNPLVTHALARAHALLETNASQLEQDAALLHAFSALIVNYADARATRSPIASCSKAVAQARAHLDAHVAINPSLSQLAHLGGVSEFQLLRAFKRELGLPPHAYLMQRRLDHARGLLRSGVTPSHAALESGFSDQAHLNRMFKRAYGITPGVYRQERKPFDIVVS
jgi:AraC-like DNA-binding protein